MAEGSFTGKLAGVNVAAVAEYSQRGAGGRGAGYVMRNVSSPSGGSASTATWSTTA